MSHSRRSAEADPRAEEAAGDLQKEVDAKLEKLLTDDQKKQFKQMRDDFARGGPPWPRARARWTSGTAVRAGPEVREVARRTPPGLFAGPPGGASLFRAYRYGPDYPGLAGKDLKPGKTVEELEKETRDEEVSLMTQDIPGCCLCWPSCWSCSSPGQAHAYIGPGRGSRWPGRSSPCSRPSLGDRDAGHLADPPGRARRCSACGRWRRAGSSGS